MHYVVRYSDDSSYRCDTSAPALARRHLGQMVHSWFGQVEDAAMSAMLSDASLVVSELVTNSVQAGATRISLTLSSDGQTLRVASVDDIAADPRRARDPVGPTAVHGRGLVLVSSVASGWGVDHHGGLKTVWAEFALPRH